MKMSVDLKALKRLSRCEAGATAVEYGLLMALMALALIGALNATGSGTQDKWDGVSEDVGDAMGA
ncbi:MAG: Flp family type IVb pilin [Alphaproteobacteria bacterium]|jgi:pilus assembly protein Flp/PilA|nr:Flp family type IVb pilin [Henriciella sp.]MBO6695122.1 Flp family type IVb pilin [Henriciella sp.]MCH9752299.1 Flp family type IVb pilin [Alphaproteobacteria bacterium]